MVDHESRGWFGKWCDLQWGAEVSTEVSHSNKLRHIQNCRTNWPGITKDQHKTMLQTLVYVYKDLMSHLDLPLTKVTLPWRTVGMCWDDAHRDTFSPHLPLLLPATPRYSPNCIITVGLNYGWLIRPVPPPGWVFPGIRISMVGFAGWPRGHMEQTRFKVNYKVLIIDVIQCVFIVPKSTSIINSRKELEFQVMITMWLLVSKQVPYSKPVSKLQRLMD